MEGTPRDAAQTPAASYADIFAQRGHRYHDAMTRAPRARDEEFARAVADADVRPGHLVCDLPSGAGYLASYLPPGARAVHIETAWTFAQLCRAATPRVVLGSFTDVPLRAGTADRVISLAALHHVEEKGRFFREAWRVLRPSGVLCIGDVRRGSAVDGFLNGFVHEHNSMGHRGVFLGPETAGEIASAGFTVDDVQPVPLWWRFESVALMIDFVGPLFGVDRAGPDDLLRGIERHLGFKTDAEGCRMQWELLFLRATRRP